MYPSELQTTRYTNMESPHDPRPHFILVPLVAQGHMIPMLDLARLLAERGARVSFITTPVNADRIRTVVDRVKESHLPIQFVVLPLPCAEAGLPDGCENADLLPSKHYVDALREAQKLLRGPLEVYLQAQTPGPSCMIADFCNPWTAEVAGRLGIPRVIFHGPSCFYLLSTHNIVLHEIYEHITDEFEPFLVPELPHQVETNLAQAFGWALRSESQKFINEASEAESTADGIVIHSFDDLEPWYLESYQKAKGKNVWTIGPLCLYNKDLGDKAMRGNKASIDEHVVTKWLDSMEPGSVIYVGFGSIGRARPLQLIEIVCGLEASNRPFIWVIKEVEMTPEAEKWMSEGFEERTSSRGLIIRGWAPQMVILSHSAIGGFLTHCGWNSALEAITAGVPLITWPQFADQFLNEKLLVDVLGIGVPVGVKVPVSPLSEDNEVMVRRDDIVNAVSRLMDGEEREQIKMRVTKLQLKATEAMKEGGSTYVNMANLIQYFREHGNKEL